MTQVPHMPTVHDNGTGGQESMPLPVVPSAMPMDPRTFKAQFFDAKRLRRKNALVTMNGMQLELRQPSIKEMMQQFKDTTNGEEDSGGKAVGAPVDSTRAVWVLINHCYIPGTEMRAFDENDADQLAELPFGEEYSVLMKTFNEMTGVKVDKEAKNSKATPSASK